MKQANEQTPQRRRLLPEPREPLNFNWLAPIANKWGVIALLIFAGLVIKVFEAPTHWLKDRRAAALSQRSTK